MNASMARAAAAPVSPSPSHTRCTVRSPRATMYGSGEKSTARSCRVGDLKMCTADSGLGYCPTLYTRPAGSPISTYTWPCGLPSTPKPCGPTCSHEAEMTSMYAYSGRCAAGKM